jgi:hypothetical protein
MIKCLAWSDDHKIKVEFDATQYFQVCSLKDFTGLVNCEFERDYPADYIATYMADYVSELARLFDYIAIAGCGFECQVEEPRFLVEWFGENRQLKEN